MPAKAGAATPDPEIGTAAGAAAAAAAGPAWRQFSFFESSPVRDADDFAKPPAALRSANEVAAICQCQVRPPTSALASDAATGSASPSEAPVSATVRFDEPSASSSKAVKANKASRKQPCTLVGTIHGRIKVLDPDTLQELAAWDAFSSGAVAGRVTHLSSDTRGRVITLGEEDSSRFPILRVWDIRTGRNASRQADSATADGAKATWMPRLLAEGKVQHGSRPHPIAAVSHTPSLSYLSVALADGTVLLIRGLESALMAASGNAGIASAGSSGRPTPAVALPKFKVVFQPTSSDSGAHEPVTALGFSEVAAPAAANASAQVKTASTATQTPAYEARVSHGSKGRKAALARQRDPRTGSANAATQADAAKPASAVHLFIVTLSRVLRYIVAGKGAGGSPAVLDDVGGALGCAAVIPPRAAMPAASSGPANAPGLPLTSAPSSPSTAGKMVIARDEAIYVIGQEGREACFAYEGPKSSIHLSASQVIIVSPPFAPASSAGPVRSFANARESPLSTPSSRKGSMLPAEVAKITIFDLDNKLVAFSGTFDSGIRQVWVGTAGEVLVLSDLGELTRLDEKPLRAKLDVLYRKSLFLLAVNLARSHMQRASSADVLARTEALMGDIYQRYGDHLYNKADYDGAMAQYVKTIGHTQPSLVIRRFLDAQRIKNLTTYLQELHAQNLASSDHTTLLLNCYTKLKDVASLDRFIKRPHARASSRADADDAPDPLGGEGEGAAEDRDELPFDLETAMRVCRQAGYFGHAAYLAKRYGEHREYLRIQIEDVKDYGDALLYVRGLQADDAIESMAQYAKTLLGELPDETTELLIELCSGAFRPDPEAAHKAMRLQQRQAEQDKTNRGTAPKSAAAAYLSYLQHPSQFVRFLETVVLARWGQYVDMDAADRSQGEPLDDDAPAYELPSSPGGGEVDEVEQALRELGLDGRADDYEDAEVADQKSIWNTLLELYLTAGEAGGGGRERALRLLQQHARLPYDVSHALMLCAVEQFDAGLILLYERMGMYEDIVRLHMASSSATSSAQVVSALARYGGSQPELYGLVLRYLVSSPELLERHTPELLGVLRVVRERALMSTLEIVQLLSSSAHTQVGVVRAFIAESISATIGATEADARAIDDYKASTEETLAEIGELTDSGGARVFQMTRCTACAGQLDLPAVHFMCKHSYHQRCLGEEEAECPTCASHQTRLRDARRRQADAAVEVIATANAGDQHVLHRAADAHEGAGFDKLAALFAQPIMGNALAAQQL
ncbi:vacuolar assembly/sorting protein PEP5/VPS11 [Moesziomyces antarcticus T-34]|uniref:Vacuolar assembly/sorting protein PEP5/VPS11 n=1 Tax=Pseudozyma antarctica (strain T-34) TaxID=1151754 RepID=M9MD68_PSEA3|nr:vacuolar assembly/sorting protein PEP5/VPS11 [Moesziomyces antarcticus T-34]